MHRRLGRQLEVMMACLDSSYRMACQLTGSPENAAGLVESVYEGFSRSPTMELCDHDKSRLRVLAAVYDRFRNTTPDESPSGWLGNGSPLARRVATLPVSQRVVLLLWAGEGLERREIARVLGLTLDAVTSLLTKAQQRLDASQLEGNAHGARHDRSAERRPFRGR